MPQAQIWAYSEQVSERELATLRRSIEASGMRIAGKPEIRRVPNDNYITSPDAPSDCYLVVFQVEVVKQ